MVWQFLLSMIFFKSSIKFGKWSIKIWTMGDFFVKFTRKVHGIFPKFDGSFPKMYGLFYIFSIHRFHISYGSCPCYWWLIVYYFIWIILGIVPTFLWSCFGNSEFFYCQILRQFFMDPNSCLSWWFFGTLSQNIKSF